MFNNKGAQKKYLPQKVPLIIPTAALPASGLKGLFSARNIKTDTP